MKLRRLNHDDRELYETVFSWEKDYPRWLRDAEKFCGMPLDEFLAVENRVDIGVFNPELTGMVSINYRGPKVFEGHIWAKRGTSVELLAWTVASIRDDLVRDLGMKAFFVWVVKKNRPIKKLCGMIGCEFDGVTMIDGESHGKPIEWQRLVWLKT